MKIHFHNAGVGGSSPPITTIFHKALSQSSNLNYEETTSTLITIS